MKVMDETMSPKELRLDTALCCTALENSHLLKSPTGKDVAMIQYEHPDSTKQYKAATAAYELLEVLLNELEDPKDQGPPTNWAGAPTGPGSMARGHHAGSAPGRMHGVVHGQNEAPPTSTSDSTLGICIEQLKVVIYWLQIWSYKRSAHDEETSIWRSGINKLGVDSPDLAALTLENRRTTFQTSLSSPDSYEKRIRQRVAVMEGRANIHIEKLGTEEERAKATNLFVILAHLLRDPNITNPFGSIAKAPLAESGIATLADEDFKRASLRTNLGSHHGQVREFCNTILHFDQNKRQGTHEHTELIKTALLNDLLRRHASE